MFPLTRSFHRRTFFLYRKLRPTSRIIHTAHIDPILQEFTPKLLAKQPAFGFLPQQICVLKQPPEFYASLLVYCFFNLFFSLYVDWPSRI